IEDLSGSRSRARSSGMAAAMKSPRSSSSLPFLKRSYALSLIACLNGTASAQRRDLVEDRRCHLGLWAPADLALATGQDDRDLVVGAVEADVRTRDVVDDDGVEALAPELGPA